MMYSHIGRHAIAVCVSIALLTGCAALQQAQVGVQPPVGASGTVQQGQTSHSARKVCSADHPGAAQCLLLFVGKGPTPACAGSACGWAPKDFQTRYKLPIERGSGQIVGIVDAGDNPDAAGDIATYRSEFGLGSASFYKYNQKGEQGHYPTYTGSSVEIDLDIEMVSASCPMCTIYLVEADSTSAADLEAAEAEVVKLGAHIVTNSWVCYSSLGCHLDPKYFSSKGVEYLAAAGVSGSGEAGAPAAFDTVSAIGGTQLAKSGSHYSETIWSVSGGACATGIKKPKWQSIIPASVCGYRLMNDAAAEAGCSPGVAEYDSFDGGWFPVCGTSVAAPLLAGAFGLAGNATSQDGGRTFWDKRHHKSLYKISGQCGYRLGQYTSCAGWGSPDGISAL